MSENNRDGVIRKSVGLYEKEAAIVEAQADELGVNFSIALRLIIRDWEKMRRAAGIPSEWLEMKG